MPGRAMHAGREIDGFSVGELVHSGGMALLWSVTHPNHALPMLMKVPRLAEGDDAAAIVGFEMEQMILPRLAGPHVPRCIAVGDLAPLPYIVMERIAGRSLEQSSEGKPQPIAELATVAAAIATALDDLHHQRLAHLDVKPANVLFRADGEAVLIDFGLSHHAELPDLVAAEFRTPYGSTPYMAPEQAMGVRDDPRSDIFALGVVLYRLATGAFPFGNPQHLSAVKRRIWRDPPPPRRLRAEVPPWLQEIILRCLEVDPAQRYPSAAQLAFALRHPDQVECTARAARMQQDGWATVLRRRFSRGSRPQFKARSGAMAAAVEAPIVAVALDLPETSPALAVAIRESLQRITQSRPGARVACIQVQRESRLALDSTLDEYGRNKHLQGLIALKEWAAPLRLDEGRISFHVLEALDPVAALLDYARANRIDHIVIGASSGGLRSKLLGSVAGGVAAQAPCSVTVVRPRAAPSD